jgi:hypothetical protein
LDLAAGLALMAGFGFSFAFAATERRAAVFFAEAFAERFAVFVFFPSDFARFVAVFFALRVEVFEEDREEVFPAMNVIL